MKKQLQRNEKEITDDRNYIPKELQTRKREVVF